MKFACTYTKTKKSYKENLWMILSSVFFVSYGQES